MADEAPRSATVWRWPVRLTHWLFVVFVAAQFITGDVLDGALDWHMRIGYAVLALVLFRVLWGFFGDRHARFTDFVTSPDRTIRYARAMWSGSAERTVGHNPLGGWAVVALLGLLGTQAISGLFIHDDVFSEGPLYAHVSDTVASAMIQVHHLGFSILLTLVAIHVGAIAFHRFRLKERLLGAMLHGRKRDLPSDYTPSSPARAWIAPVLLVLCIAAVVTLVLVAQATAPADTFY